MEGEGNQDGGRLRAGDGGWIVKGSGRGGCWMLEKRSCKETMGEAENLREESDACGWAKQRAA